MPKPIDLETAIRRPEIPADPDLAALLQEADQRTDAIMFFNCVVDLKIPYINQSFTQMLGYARQELISAGPAFLFSIGDPVVLGEMVRRQAAYNEMAKSPVFNPLELIIQEYPVALKSKAGEWVHLQGLGVVLTYTAQRDMDFGVAFMALPNESTLKACRQLLRQIKMRHTELINDAKVGAPRDYTLVHVGSTRMDSQLTPREIQVLKNLAAGLSTKESAVELNITENTIETYRKNLLRKFDAKNTAELIKKASKVFWLD